MINECPCLWYILASQIYNDNKVMHYLNTSCHYLEIPEFWECIHNDTKYYVEENGGEENIECHLVDHHVAKIPKGVIHWVHKHDLKNVEHKVVLIHSKVIKYTQWSTQRLLKYTHIYDEVHIYLWWSTHRIMMKYTQTYGEIHADLWRNTQTDLIWNTHIHMMKYTHTYDEVHTYIWWSTYRHMKKYTQT